MDNKINLSIFLIVTLFFSKIILGQNTKVKSFYKGSKIVEYEWEYLVTNKSQVSDIELRDSKTNKLKGYDNNTYSFENKVMHGKCYHYSKTEKLLDVITYNNGYKFGPAIFYYENGNKLASFNYSGNYKIEGEFKEFNEDGTIYQDCQYKEGVRLGKGYIYYNDGKIQFEIDYKGGINSDFDDHPKFELADVINYNVNQKKIATGKVKLLESKETEKEYGEIDLITVGEWIYFDETNQNITEKINYDYKDGEKSGKNSIYINGTLRQEINYEVNKVKSGKYYGLQQSIIIGPYKKYYPNGNLEIDGYYQSFIHVKEQNLDTFIIYTYKDKIWKNFDENKKLLQFLYLEKRDTILKMNTNEIEIQSSINESMDFKSLKKNLIEKYNKYLMYHFGDVILWYQDPPIRTEPEYMRGLGKDLNGECVYNFNKANDDANELVKYYKDQLGSCFTKSQLLSIDKKLTSIYGRLFEISIDKECKYNGNSSLSDFNY